MYTLVPTPFAGLVALAALAAAAIASISLNFTAVHPDYTGAKAAPFISSVSQSSGGDRPNELLIPLLLPAVQRAR
jgi:hypothetical protein